MSGTGEKSRTVESWSCETLDDQPNNIGYNVHGLMSEDWGKGQQFSTRTLHTTSSGIVILPQKIKQQLILHIMVEAHI